ncbi:MAG: radical SAM protein [Candidatus Omnitrophota bacterium]|nr:radical SAM protein [Candidatus Omnitrophota bacterium]
MNLIQRSLNQKVIENIKKEGIPVIIFGAGIVGEALFYACCNAGIKIECFCDNNINKTKTSMCNIKVIHTPNLKKKYMDANFLISAADIKDVVDQLHELGYSKWYPASLLLKDFDVSRYRFSAPVDFVEYAVGTCLLCHDSYLIPDKLFLRSVDIIITERCSLKCRDCSNLMQYYKKPVDCNIEELMQSIDMLCYLIDEVNEFRVIGGEPFMNKEIHLIIKRLIDEPKIHKIVIYTNGTIIPKEDQIEYLKNNKLLFIITDYGMLSKKLNILTQLLQQNKIAFYILRVRGWADCAKIMRHYRNIERQKEIFKSCCAKNTATLSKGKLYRCPFVANAARLLAVPDFESDYINIFQEPQEAVDIYEMKNKIRAFLLEKDFLETCDYCNGRPFEAPEIPVAIQTDKPLEYNQYLL